MIAKKISFIPSFLLHLLFVSFLSFAEDPFTSTYKPAASEDIFITNAKILVGNGTYLESGDIYISNNKIKLVGTNLDAPTNVSVIDAKDKWVTPGIIDIHSHMGVYPALGRINAHM